MESTKEQFNKLAEMFVKSFTESEKNIYLEKVINRYTPEEMKVVCDYIRKDVYIKHFPTPIEFERIYYATRQPEKRDEYPDVPPEQKKAFFEFFKKECLEPLVKAMKERE